MKTRLIQLVNSDDFEALFSIPADTSEEEIQAFYKTFIKHQEEVPEFDADFETYMDEFFPEESFERVFVTEIYV